MIMNIIDNKGGDILIVLGDHTIAVWWGVDGDDSVAVTLGMHGIFSGRWIVARTGYAPDITNELGDGWERTDLDADMRADVDEAARIRTRIEKWARSWSGKLHQLTPIGIEESLGCIL